jgi:predicted DCC family thiol-disulfide oxidoreductase YuxK
MRPTLIFDGDCGFCTASVTFTRRWIKPDCDIAPWQLADLGKYGLTEHDCTSAVQFVDASGRAHAGSRAIARMLGTARFPWPALGWCADLPGISSIAALVYRWTARNRHRLPGSTKACATDSPSSAS